MSELFQAQLDYIFFLYGLAFIVLAAVCFSLQRAEWKRFPWTILGLFGLAHGGNEWLDLLALTLGDSSLFQSGRLLVLALSYLFLLEFARAGQRRLRGSGPGRGILLLPVALAIAGGWATGLTGAHAVTRYALGLTGGLWAAAALYRYAEKKTGRERFFLITAAACMALFAAATGMIVPDASVFPASLLNTGYFLRWTGLPIQMIRGLLTLVIAAAIINYSMSPLDSAADSNLLGRNFRSLHWTFMFVLGLCLSAGFALTLYLGGHARTQVAAKGKQHMMVLVSHMNSTLQEPPRAVEILAGSPWIETALISGAGRDIDIANIILDQYRESLDVSVCYLLDTEGTAVASSNRFNPESFLGRSYDDWSYFKISASGSAATQFAFDIPSGERCFYAGAPIYTPDRRITGVAVIKQVLDRAEADFLGYDHVFFVSPEGIIFLSSKPEMRLMSLWPLSASAKQAILTRRTFGTGPFRSFLAAEPVDGSDVLLDSRRYLVTRKFVNREGWSLILLNSTEIIAFYRLMAILITLTVCLLTIGLSVGFQKSLESAAKSAVLESRFRAIYENAPSAIFIAEIESGRIISCNPFMREWLGYDDNELLAMTLQDLRAPGDEQESRYRKKDGEDVDVEEVRTKIPFHEKDGLLVIAHDISEHKRVEELLDRLSRHDGLTGIANRRHFDEVLEQEWKRALRERTNLSLILCDIDFFKAFNDTYGHQQGDECLQAVAGALVQHMRRPMDLASRYGGEEFSVILPDTPREGALIVAEELRSGVEALGIPHASSAAGPVVTISLGIATLIPRTDKSPAELIGAADNALYRAKAEGRNRSAS